MMQVDWHHRVAPAGRRGTSRGELETTTPDASRAY